MPEGPSILIAKEELQSFRGKKIVHASGYSNKVLPEVLINRKITDIKSWGKHLLICFSGFTIRIHFMIFGSYLVNERNQRKPKLSLQFSGKKEINFYACDIKRIDEDLDDVYDWSGDIMNKKWSDQKALEKISKKPDELACDIILNQDIFAGAGNIIKNEALWRVKVHPLSKIGKLTTPKRKSLIREVVKYSFDFLKWRKAGELKKHWDAYAKKTCPRDGHAIEKKYSGKTKRRSFYCPECQQLFR